MDVPLGGTISPSGWNRFNWLLKPVRAIAHPFPKSLNYSPFSTDLDFLATYICIVGMWTKQLVIFSRPGASITTDYFAEQNINRIYNMLLCGKANKTYAVSDAMWIKVRWSQNEFMKLSIFQKLTWKIWRISALRVFIVHTLMPVYHCHKPVLLSKWPLASSLLQAIKTCRQACSPGYVMRFS